MADKSPRRQAVALAYTQYSNAPRVVAKGWGEVADRIIDRAQDAGVFVHESPELVNLLMQIDLDSQIPSELYQAVAEVLAFVYFLERQASGEPMPDRQVLPPSLDSLPRTENAQQ